MRCTPHEFCDRYTLFCCDVLCVVCCVFWLLFFVWAGWVHALLLLSAPPLLLSCWLWCRFAFSNVVNGIHPPAPFLHLATLMPVVLLRFVLVTLCLCLSLFLHFAMCFFVLFSILLFPLHDCKTHGTGAPGSDADGHGRFHPEATHESCRRLQSHARGGTSNVLVFILVIRAVVLGPALGPVRSLSLRYGIWHRPFV